MSETDSKSTGGNPVRVRLSPRALVENPPPPATSLSMSVALPADRAALVRRGLWLNFLALAYNMVEAIVSIAAGLVAGSVALLGFGVDSGIEVTASVAAQW